MNNTISNLIIFSSGVAIGVAASWKFFETKYKKISQEEIDSVKKVFSLNKENNESTFEPDRNPENDESKENKLRGMRVKIGPVDEYAKFVKDLGYTDEEKGVENMHKRPYILSPDEFGELANYDTESFTYYADGVLTDESNNPIKDAGAIIVEDFADHFGEYEDDSVFVRNDSRKTDYEILRDERNFSDVKNSRTYPVDEE